MAKEFDPYEEETHEPSGGGLIQKLKVKATDEAKPVKHIDEKKFRRIVLGYLDGGYSVAKISKRMKRFRVNGEKIDIGEILAIKKTWSSEKPDIVPVDPNDVFSEPKTISDKILYDTYERAKKDNDREMIKRIQDRIIPLTSSEKPVETRIVEAWLREKSSPPPQNQPDPITVSLLARISELEKRNTAILNNDPQVAMAQVLGPQFQQGVHEVTETMRELGGLRKKDKLSDADAKKIQEAEALFNKYQEQMKFANENYIVCPTCRTVVPRRAGQCYVCGTRFAPQALPQSQYVPIAEPVVPVVVTPPKGGIALSVPEEPLKKSEVGKRPKWVEEWLNRNDGKLVRLRNKIENGHDSEKTFAGLWGLIDIDEQKKLLYAAEQGMGSILARVRPYVKENDEIELLGFYEIPSTKNWIERGFEKIRELARTEVWIRMENGAKKEITGIILTDEEKAKYENEFKKGEEAFLKTRNENSNMEECINCHEMIRKDKMAGHYAACIKG